MAAAAAAAAGPSSAGPQSTCFSSNKLPAPYKTALCSSLTALPNHPPTHPPLAAAFHLVALTALMAVAEALCAFTGPAWAEGAASTLLGNGRVAEVGAIGDHAEAEAGPFLRGTSWAVHCDTLAAMPLKQPRGAV